MPPSHGNHAAPSSLALDQRRTPLLDHLAVATKNDKPKANYQSTTSATSSSFRMDSIGDGGGSNGDHFNDDDYDDDDSNANGNEHLTTVWETFFHLVKGYIGVGLLSLPWAVSQLGIPLGCVAVFLMSAWSSYNCWTVVRVKRYIEHQRNGGEHRTDPILNLNNNNNANDEDQKRDVTEDDDDNDDAGSTATTNTNITYPDLGEWAYGKTFQKYVTFCICTQQMAICTVFISFIGENLNALLHESSIDFGFWETHTGVLTVALPCCLSLSFIPSLKGLAPIMAAGSVLVVVTLVLLGIVGGKEWDHRPEPQDLPSLDIPSAPLALCGILYSYEGICLILPIESAMAEPKHFDRTFASAMAVVATVMAVFGSFCVYAFGEVDNGSVTAFLLQHYHDEPSLRWWLRMANTTISLSVLLTYPLQLFPAVEILGPSVSRFLGDRDFAREERELNDFDPMPALPEDGEYMDVDDVADTTNGQQQHVYDTDNNQHANEDTSVPDSSLRGILNRAGSSLGVDMDDAASFVMEFPNQMLPKMMLPGDSPQLRTLLVLFTYTIAVVVPNVQSLISLAGALAGSSSALIIPPILELAWLQHLDSHNPNTSTSPEPRSQVPFADRMASTSPPNSPMLRNMPRSSNPVSTPSWLSVSKLKCYGLIVAGMVFLLLGTYDSLADIIAIYSGQKDD